ncbi:MAG: hypothetical protein AB7O37_15135 [Vicinamibacteria bacterium]
MAKDTLPGRCLNCKSEVQVPNTFAEGEIIQCGSCRLSLKILRRGALRLVIADVGPLRDELRFAQQRVAGLESELARARASFGIGANGLGLGVLYIVAQVALEEQELTRGLIGTAVAIALASGVALELANYLFLAKRREMARLSADIETLQGDVRQMQAKIRESLRR